MKKRVKIFSLLGLLSVLLSCGDKDSSMTSKWKDVWYAFQMEKVEDSLEGLEVDITYINLSNEEQVETVKDFDRWEEVVYHVSTTFMPRMKLEIKKSEKIEYTEADFPARIKFVAGISEGSDAPVRIEVDKLFDNLDEFETYIEGTGHIYHVIPYLGE